MTDASEESWRQTREKVAATYTALRDAMLALDDARLDKPINDGRSSRYVSLHGAIQHTLYHAGQIAFVKRALGQKLPPVVPEIKPT